MLVLFLCCPDRQNIYIPSQLILAQSYFMVGEEEKGAEGGGRGGRGGRGGVGGRVGVGGRGGVGDAAGVTKPHGTRARLGGDCLSVIPLSLGQLTYLPCS